MLILNVIYVVTVLSLASFERFNTTKANVDIKVFK